MRRDSPGVRRRAGALVIGGGSSAAHVEPSVESDSRAIQRARSSRLGDEQRAGSAGAEQGLEAAIVPVADGENDPHATGTGERGQDALTDGDGGSGRDPVGKRVLDGRVERDVGNHGPTLIACGGRRTPAWRA